MSGIDLTVSLVEIHYIREKYGLSFVQASKKYQEIINKKNKLEEEIRSAETKLKTTKQNLSEELKAAKTSSEGIRKFTEIKNTLRQFDIPVDDYDKLPTLMSNLMALSNEPKQIVDFYSSHKELEKKEKELNDSVDSLSYNESRLSSEIKRLELTSEEKKIFVNSLRLLEAQNLTPENMRVLTEAIAAVGTKHGLTSKESIEKLTTEVNDRARARRGDGAEANRSAEALKRLSPDPHYKQRNFLNEALDIAEKIQIYSLFDFYQATKTSDLSLILPGWKRMINSPIRARAYLLFQSMK